MRTDRYAAFGLTESDEPFRRAVRDGFQGAGLTRAQFTQALEWFRDRGQHLGGDVARIAEDFAKFAGSAGWSAEAQVAAASVYEGIRQGGPEAVMAPPPTAQEDAATIAKANELLSKDAAAYFRDDELQERMFEALERQAAPQSGPALGPPLTDVEIEQKIGRQDMQKFERMMREEPQRYWGSPQLQEAYRDAIERATAAPEAEAPAAAPLGVADGVAAAAAEPRTEAV
jgi:hypothetical protein